MKAKELAEQLLNCPDFDVEFCVLARRTTVDHPWADYISYKVCGIEDVLYDNKVITLEVESK